MLKSVKLADVDLYSSLAAMTKKALYIPEPLPERKVTAITFDDLWIRTKDKRVIRLDPNPIQIQYLDIIAPGWREHDYRMTGMREIIDKSRQFGFSTIILALFFLDTINNPNTYSVCCANKGSNTTTLFGMVQFFYKMLPASKILSDGTVWKKPHPDYANRQEFQFAGLNSRFFIGSAGSVDFGRGGTINNFHGSEVGFWEHGDDIVAGALQAVPMEGNVILESTANGIGNYFEVTYRKAEKGQSNFKARFYPWYQHEDYQADVPDGFARTKEEQKLVDAFGVNDRQLAWRRIKEMELGYKLPQEYPSTANESFLVSGFPYFNRSRLGDIDIALDGEEFAPLTLEETPSCQRDRLRELILNSEHIGDVKKTNWLKVWDPPEFGHRYIVTADVSEGLTDQGEADYDSCDVIDVDTGVQVAHLYGKYDPAEYGRLINDVGHWYSWAVKPDKAPLPALVVIERNNHGHSVLNTLVNECQYPECTRTLESGLYLHEEFDEYHKKQSSKKLGWPTSVKTKYEALARLATSIIEQDIKLRSKITVSELMTFVKKPGGKAGGEGKSNDDCVMSLAIGEAVRFMIPKNRTRLNLPKEDRTESSTQSSPQEQKLKQDIKELRKKMDPELKRHLGQLGKGGLL